MSNATAQPAPAPPRRIVAVMAEFADVDSVMNAARRCRDTGFRLWDVHSPFPIHGIDRAMGNRPTVLPWLVMGGGVAGALLGLWLQYFTNVLDYPYLISGKPLFSLPANIPVIFELAVLLAALTAVFGMLALNLLPMLHNPLFAVERFRRVTSDRFFVVIYTADPAYDPQRTPEMLRSLGASAVEMVEE